VHGTFIPRKTDMEFDAEERPGPVTCVRLRGRLDAAGAGRIETRFTAATVAAGHPAIVDLSGVSFIASMGVGLLIAAARGLRNKGRLLVLFGAPEPVRAVLDLAEIGQIIPIAADEAEALAQLSA
jgi:anti-sigma B factor antagonist